MFCEIYLLDAPYHIDRAFDYVCLPDLRVGSIVKVPFGKANTLRLGVVSRLKDFSEGNNIKPVHSVISEHFSFTDEMLGLCLFLKEHTLSTFGEAAKCLIPPGSLSEKLNIKYSKTLSLAIGAKGQNVRLAAKLTQIKIDINAEGLQKTPRSAE